ncbi:uncharacterized protein L969DRAFT_92992 [Mixia osmundae IAM 14324]|uniref:BBC1/AIM3 cysteine proteinase-fold domain-containing protein n=1 Tax=Mixia osmundae (strain CBS 9802 / IAM 14324 / JCM 22182 / KY 12970) TaxID=764103 RepID=G7DU02_MIXOS|nr:uncharacterized protein L969DRAFT_92992 [Mixia osmundae IAM 14324]KEI41775.1 hypothetical protein L969DRAFT_92992 [Mixia osmundae IAM 14324]GAA94062.1 hypothetical protein E5Q_00709 [Mixia osmundae IAM 14324]
MAPFDVARLRAQAEGSVSQLREKINTVKPAPGAPVPAQQPAYTFNRGRVPPAPDVTREQPRVGSSKLTRLSAQDKAAFFGLLDDFFGGQRAALPAKAALPNDPLPVSSFAPGTDLTSSSYPPPPSDGWCCHAAAYASFFRAKEAWSSAWYDHSPVEPPPLHGRTDVTHASTGSTQTFGFPGSMTERKTWTQTVLFLDLSVARATVQWDRGRPVNSEIARSCDWRPAPSPLDGGTLYAAHIQYGNAIACFAERHEGVQSVGNGECWTLAAEALKEASSLSQSQLGPPILDCIGKTHGHLLYTAKAGRLGQWRGGDNALRRGDVVQWLTAIITHSSSASMSTARLGDPDHTAILVADSPPREPVEHGSMMSTASLGSITVIEQSRGHLPSRATYDLANLSQGEIWLYRPIMVSYVGLPGVINPLDLVQGTLSAEQVY